MKNPPKPTSASRSTTAPSHTCTRSSKPSTNRTPDRSPAWAAHSGPSPPKRSQKPKTHTARRWQDAGKPDHDSGESARGASALGGEGRGPPGAIDKVRTSYTVLGVCVKKWVQTLEREHAEKNKGLILRFFESRFINSPNWEFAKWIVYIVYTLWGMALVTLWGKALIF